MSSEKAQIRPFTLSNLGGNDAGGSRRIANNFSFSSSYSGNRNESEDKELGNIKKKAFDEGYQKGLREGQELGHQKGLGESHELNTKLGQVVSVITESLGNISQELKSQKDQLERDCTALSLSIAKHIAQDALSKDMETNIVNTVKSCSVYMLGEPELNVVVNPKLEEKVKESISKDNTIPGELKLKITSDGEIEEGDVRLSWAGGGAYMSLEKRWNEVEEKLVGVLKGHPVIEKEKTTVEENSTYDQNKDSQEVVENSNLPSGEDLKEDNNG